MQTALSWSRLGMGPDLGSNLVTIRLSFRFSLESVVVLLLSLFVPLYALLRPSPSTLHWCFGCLRSASEHLSNGMQQCFQSLCCARLFWTKFSFVSLSMLCISQASAEGLVMCNLNALFRCSRLEHRDEGLQVRHWSMLPAQLSGLWFKVASRVDFGQDTGAWKH